MRVRVRFLDGEELEGESEALSLTRLGFPLALSGLNSKIVWLSLSAIKYVVVHPTDPTALGPVDPREAEGLPKVVLRFLDGEVVRTYEDEVFGQEGEGLNVRLWNPETRQLQSVLISPNVLKGVFFVDEWDGRSDDEKTEQDLKRRRRTAGSAEPQAEEPVVSWRKWSSTGNRRTGRSTGAPAVRIARPNIEPAQADEPIIEEAPLEDLSTRLPPRPVPAAEPLTGEVDATAPVTTTEVIVVGSASLPPSATENSASDELAPADPGAGDSEVEPAASEVIVRHTNETASDHPGALRRRMSQRQLVPPPLPELPPVAERPEEAPPPPPLAPEPAPLSSLPPMPAPPTPESGWPEPPGTDQPAQASTVSEVTPERRRLRSQIAETLGANTPSSED